MPWYIIGTLFVIPCFMGIFTYPTFIIGNFTTTQRQAWYITLPGLFNIGWACVQISHMAIVNNLSASNQKRDKLVNYRNGFSYAANITILSFALILFSVLDDNINQFRYLCFIALFIGSFSSIFYILTIKEVRLTQEAKDYDAIYKREIMGED